VPTPTSIATSPAIVQITCRLRAQLPAEKCGVDKAEDRGIGADAKAENEDRGGREAPVSDESPNGVARVAQGRVDGERAFNQVGLIAHARLL